MLPKSKIEEAHQLMGQTLTINLKTTEKYRDWDILDEMPQGWKIDKTVGSPLFRAVFITNGKSVLNGQKRALLRIKVPQVNSK